MPEHIEDPDVKAMHDFLDGLDIFAVNVKEQLRNEKKAAYGQSESTV